MDRRHYDRELTNLKVYAREDTKPARALQARDISSDGLYLDGWPDAPPAGTRLDLTIVIEAGSSVRLLHRNARVERKTESGVGLTHFGQGLSAPPRTPASPWSELNWPQVD